uniref:CCHC-type domain-containing protein n=1 Tax=Vombatus ursinus TaxID=29139 RepID=A0A4X2M4F1_VOMUR
MASYEGTNPGTIPERHHLIYQVIHSTLKGASRNPLRVEIGAQTERPRGEERYKTTQTSCTFKMGGAEISGEEESGSEAEDTGNRKWESRQGERKEEQSKESSSYHTEGWPPPPDFPFEENVPSAPPAPSYGAMGDPPTRLGQMLQKAVADGDMDAKAWLDACQVFETDEGRTWAPLEWEKLKELKEAVNTYGVESPYVRELMVLLADSHILTPNDWKTIAKVCLKPGETLQWMTLFADTAKNFVRDMQSRTPQDDFQKIVGAGRYEKNEDQMRYDVAVYAAVSQCAQRAFSKIEASGKQRPSMTKIKQGPDEPFPDFVACLQVAVERSVGGGEAASLLVQRLAQDNANVNCQKAMLTLDGDAGLEEMIKRCEHIGSSAFQLDALAAAISKGVLEGMKTKETKLCYQCGKAGHFKVQCRQKPGGARPKVICHSCNKPGHYAKECRKSKSGNGARGPLRAPQQAYQKEAQPPQRAPSRLYQEYLRFLPSGSGFPFTVKGISGSTPEI